MSTKKGDDPTGLTRLGDISALQTLAKTHVPATCMLTPAQQCLLEQSARIFDEPATIQDAAYLPRELVQVTLPHKNPGNIPLWRRTNGNLTLGIQPGIDLKTGESCGFPYGTIPRLLLFWVTTEALRTKSPRLELGNSLSGFMAELGLNSANGGTGAKRSDARRYAACNG
jgi:Plasmid encoded RepA protein